MEIKTTQYDMTDPFAQLKQRAVRLDTFLQQLPQAQQEQVLDALLPPIPLYQPPAAIEPAVQMVTVKVAAWEGETAVPQSLPTFIQRRRRTVRHVTWQWRLMVACIRLTRRMRKSLRQKMRSIHKRRRRKI